MATLGRLDIHYPDGRVERLALTGVRTSVGAAADNAIVLRSDSIAAYQFELLFDSGACYLFHLDDDYGTRVAGADAQDEKLCLLSDGAEIIAGDLRIIFCAGNDELTVPLASVSDSTQIVMSTFDVGLDRSRIDVFPASAASAEIIISNRIESAQRFEITVEGMPDEWVTLSQPTAAVEGGGSHVVYLYITPPRRADVAPADYPVTIAVRPAGQERREQTRSLTVGVGPFTGLSAAVEPAEIGGDSPLRLYLLNQGNAALPLSLSASSGDSDPDIILSQDKVQLDAGQRMQVEAIAAGKRPLAGQTRESSDCHSGEGRKRQQVPGRAASNGRIEAANFGRRLDRLDNSDRGGPGILNCDRLTASAACHKQPCALGEPGDQWHARNAALASRSSRSLCYRS